ncbi:MAG: dystroglycan-type cadherin-like domain repeat protein, partial [Verrucomicrobiales bacterium]|nr:dystroglycan-type cadherin-like domain repeat protein [Verrucomicrobiales bacterium]
SSTTVSIDVLKADSLITWSAPSAITYGTALSSTQLNASKSVPGILAYTPAAGTVLDSGANQTLSVTLTPDNTNYNGTSTTVSIDVLKADSSITWSAPSAITYGSALTTNELNAVASIPGTLVYSPTNGTVLNAGTNQTLSVSFTPADTNNYTGANANVLINVNLANMTVSVSNASRPFGLNNPPFSGLTTGLRTGDSITVTYASAATSSSPVGTYPILPILSDVSGRLANYVVTTNAGTLTITKALVSMTIAGDHNPVLLAQSVKVTSTVTSALNPKPTGTVQFSVDTVNVGAAVPIVSGVASIDLVLTNAGAHVIRGAYLGDINYTTTNRPVILQVNAPNEGRLVLIPQNDGTQMIRFLGDGVSDYVIESSSDLVSWTYLGNTTLALDGLYELTDGAAPSAPIRFYRAVKF